MKIIIPFILICVLVSCATTKYIPVTTTETHYINVHDTLITRDTIIQESTTIIRELDSVTMSKYGIDIDAKQKAWLLENTSYQKQISMSIQSHSDTIRDTIPVTTIITETKTVQTDIPDWKKVLMYIGAISLTFCILYIIYKLKQNVTGS